MLSILADLRKEFKLNPFHMYRFWDSVTRPLLEILRPQSVVEVGVSTGRQTTLLLRFAREYGAVVHAIDTDVALPLEELEKEFPAQLRFHHSTSLEALSALPLCDVYLIDGDHNWYTVFQELRTIGERAQGHTHPVILLHDTGWPYGRRDQYYNLERIPPSQQQPSVKAGVVPEQMDLFADGINAHYVHATKEGGEHNGVLTAVEDYIAQSPISLSKREVYGLHGLSIVYPSELEMQHPELHAFLLSLHPTRSLEAHISTLEQNRLVALRDVAMLMHAHEDLQRRFCASLREVMHVRTALSEAIPGPSARQIIDDAEKERTAAVTLVNRMSNSLSWRLTIPLRRAQAFFREWTPRRVWHTAIRDMHTLWHTIHTSITGRSSEESPLEQPSVPPAPATVAMRWNEKDIPASLETLESMLHVLPQPEYGLVIGNGMIPSEVSKYIEGRKNIQWIDGQGNPWQKTAAEHCKGVGVVLLESGVMLHPFYLTCALEALYHRPAAAITYSEWHERENGHVHHAPDSYTTNTDRGVLHSACMLRREAFIQAVYAGAYSWDAIVTHILQQGWNAVRNRGLVFFPRKMTVVRDEQPYATLCLALSGRTWMWAETRAFLERQIYPHNRIHLIILDTSQDESFGLMIRTWLSSCDYTHQTYLRETVGPKQLADQPREDVVQVMSDACAAIYNRFARMTTTSVVFTLEDDVIPPDDAFVRLSATLIRRRVQTVSGAYRHRLEPRMIAWYWSENERPVDVPGGGQGIEQVGGTGFGCLAIDGSLFSRTVFRSGPRWNNFDTNFFHDLVLIDQQKALLDWDCPCRHYVNASHWVSPF